MQWILVDQNFTFSTPYSLYLRTKPDTYFVSTVNTLPKIATALPVIAALVVGVTADRLGHGSMDTDLSASGNFWPQLSSGFHLKSSYNCRMILER